MADSIHCRSLNKSHIYKAWMSDILLNYVNINNLQPSNQSSHLFQTFGYNLITFHYLA